MPNKKAWDQVNSVEAIEANRAIKNATIGSLYESKRRKTRTSL